MLLQYISLQTFADVLILGAFYELSGILWTFKGIFPVGPAYPTLIWTNTPAEFSISYSSFITPLTAPSCSDEWPTNQIQQ